MHQCNCDGAMPCDCEEQVNDALCQMGAALSVLEMHAERVQSPEISAIRDLLHRYHEEAHHTAGLVHMAAPVVCLLNDLSLNLRRIIALVGRLHGDDNDDPILYAVSYLLLSARRFAEGGACTEALLAGSNGRAENQ